MNPETIYQTPRSPFTDELVIAITRFPGIETVGARPVKGPEFFMEERSGDWYIHHTPNCWELWFDFLHETTWPIVVALPEFVGLLEEAKEWRLPTR